MLTKPAVARTPEADAQAAACRHYWLVVTVPDHFHGFSVDKESCRLCGNVRYVKRDFYTGKAEIIDRLPDPQAARQQVHYELGVTRRGAWFVATICVGDSKTVEKFHTLEEANEWSLQTRSSK